MTAFKILLVMIFTPIFVAIIGFIDFQIITPLLPIPEDICYYHSNDPPTWIRLFYLDNMEHTEPPYSGLHMSVILITSIIFATITAYKTDKYLLTRNKNVT